LTQSRAWGAGTCHLAVVGSVCPSPLWQTKVMVTYSAFVAKSVSQWLRLALRADRKITPFSKFGLSGFRGGSEFASLFGKEDGANNEDCGNS
jgi:hypothetical protein